MNMLQNDGTRNGDPFNMRTSFDANINNTVNSSDRSNRDYTDRAARKSMLASFHEEIVSSASFLSKTSSKFEVDEFE